MTNIEKHYNNIFKKLDDLGKVLLNGKWNCLGIS